MPPLGSARLPSAQLARRLSGLAMHLRGAPGKCQSPRFVQLSLSLALPKLTLVEVGSHEECLAVERCASGNAFARRLISANSICRKANLAPPYVSVNFNLLRSIMYVRAHTCV